MKPASDLSSRALSLIKGHRTPRPNERRSLNRPHFGDLRPCPRCAGMRQFRVQFFVDDAQTVTASPAWICPVCRLIDRVRGTA